MKRTSLETVEQELTVGDLLASSSRRKSAVFICTLSGGIIALLVNLVSPKVWKSQFDIVLRDENSEDVSSLSALTQFNPSGLSSELQTQLLILQSEYVLKPVYNKVISDQAKKTENFANFSFSDWIEQHLDFNLEKGTSVLSVAYIDKDPNYARQVLSSISNAYQDYSTRNLYKKLSLEKEHIQRSLNMLRVDAENAQRELDRFTQKSGPIGDG